MKFSELLTELGSDKCTRHSYGQFYDSIISTRKISAVMEIGILRGASLKAWHLLDSGIFTLGVDKDPVPGFNQVVANTPDFAPVVEHCIVNALTFDLIIDDGSHLRVDQITGLKQLNRFVRPGGLYVIEDIQKQATIDEMRDKYNATIIDLRKMKGCRDDVIAYWNKPFVDIDA
jgi:hypothetical protein